MRRRRFTVVVGVLVAIGVLVSWMSCSDSTRPSEPRPELRRPEAPHQQATRTRERARAAVDAGRQERASHASVQRAPSDVPVPGAPAPSTRSITVSVTDEGGAPIEDVWTYLVADASAGGERLQGRTDTSGVVRFLAASGPHRVDVAEKSAVGRSFLPVGLVRVGESETDVGIRLREGAVIEGRVVDEVGDPVSRANVALLGPDGFRNNITTYPTGAFRLAAPRGSTCDLRLGFAGAELFPDEDFEGALDGVAAGTSGVVLRARRVPKDRTLSVVVVDPDGSPLPGAFVAVALRVVVQMRNADADGRCRLEGLPGRELSVAAWSLGGDVHATSRPVSMVPNGQEIVVRLRRANPVRVVLVDASGAAVSVRGVYVSARAGGSSGAWARSDESGRLVLSIPADEPGLWRLEAREDPDGTVLGADDVSVPTAREVRLPIDRKPRR
jgi:hypothetical protein